ncbi:hypothetical protein PPYR_00997 [Photinus pyralis]|uniref:Alanine--tRNA ligase n=2 Tax=Photinus pyralis TaxID=7054 RepID=A0A1Y1N1B4_PHOPY|nr:alanine--tRNA ligase, mitochondrial [Photinus pyralis]KAB0804027.1 hypothetical protein PPYR_00997 [Photinus pyralis]
MEHFKLRLAKHVLTQATRKISKYLDKDRSSKAIRTQFMNYFVNDCSHNFVRSSPVVPLHDSSVPFVNAGMNQFKGIFLGTQTALHKKVANSQKCVRVGGKHNDLNVIGLDGYHHTFFEMLGNWSFGECVKMDAIKLVWDLLIQKYKIPKDLLYVTYFGGDATLGLEADIECKHIWRSLGVAPERIVPFGAKDNFWEMGATGPCGTCTEIHVDRLGYNNRSNFINKGLQDLTELWNIVFIEYNRKEDGTIEPLPESHVDTGMGFERLTAVLQGKMSNYDTDLFSDIFRGIEKICKGVPQYKGQFGENDWDHLDTSYRILADHARMITVCLADGVIPDQNQKLRKIMRKAFLVSEIYFKKEGLLKELSNYVVETLGYIYPELEKNITQVHDIISYEEDVHKLLRKNSLNEWQHIITDEPKLANLDIVETPGLTNAYKEIKSLPDKVISPKVAFKLYDTYGVDEEIILRLSEALGMKFVQEDFKHELNVAKEKSRGKLILNEKSVMKQLIVENTPLTNDEYKYQYTKEAGTYSFPLLQVKLLKVVCDNVLLSNLTCNVECDIILDKSNFYTQSGGQLGDHGSVKFGKSSFEIKNTRKVGGFILHRGVLKSEDLITLPLESVGYLEIDMASRLGCMKNHTATHLVNCLLKNIKSVTCQKSSKVTSRYLTFDVGIFGSKLSSEDLEKVEAEVKKLIAVSVDVTTYDVDSQELHALDNVVCIPGETYPSIGIRLVEIKSNDGFLSREPCCGTHVLNTSDLEDFCFIGMQSLGRTTTSLHAVTGYRAKLAQKNGSQLLQEMQKCQKQLKNYNTKPNMVDTALTLIKQKLKYDIDSDSILPFTIKQNCLDFLNNISQQIKEMQNNLIESEIRLALKRNGEDQKFIVHYLECSKNMDTLPLHKATKVCRQVPVLVISKVNNVIRARCCVPERLKNEKFDAEKWLGNTVGTIFDSVLSNAKDQDTTLVSNLKSRKINTADCDQLLKMSIEAATNYARQYLK